MDLLTKIMRNNPPIISKSKLSLTPAFVLKDEKYNRHKKYNTESS